jgi:hypothetical protein
MALVQFQSKRSATMYRPANQASTTLLIRGLLVLLCVLAVPRLGSTEPRAAADQQDASSTRPNATSPDGGQRRRITSNLFPESDACPIAKVDISLERGALTYSIHLPGQGTAQLAKAFSAGADGTTMLIGEKDCLIRIRIERATDLAVYDRDLGKSLIDAVERSK